MKYYKYCQNCDLTFPDECPNRFCGWHCRKEYDYKTRAARREKLYEEQNGLCGFCKKPLLRPEGKLVHVDHDHKTGKIRALVHRQCNFDIGFFERIREILPELAQYVDYYKQNPGTLKY